MSGVPSPEPSTPDARPAPSHSSAPTAPPLVVVMGVSGSGKTTVGAALAQRLHVPFADADDFHPEANIAKMSAGVPLDDDDRWPWLAAIADWLVEHRESGGVASCSALKRAYRDVLVADTPQARFVHLHGDRAVLAARVAGRPGHFMPAALVDSQFATLEPLQPDEQGTTLDVDQSVDTLVDQSAAYLADAPASRADAGAPAPRTDQKGSPA
ncbi:gluconate kinase, SKI family [Pedococcus dokdonensis]|uniref:Gluconokinase n=1 Tax=Pedococcus dokdonensis TaxID=443156 RepID=A0A1H0QX10_9MICO|nr:gluconokinase [Pedococcus dokdonensis]SDP21842.1 gluconate kinase, SKI family [Pedococcus dokdonensis]